MQEPITWSLHLCCTLESTLSNEELFLERAFPQKSIVSEDVNVNESDWAAHWLVDWLLRIRAWQILRTDWLIGYYALWRDKFCPKTVSINNFSSERVDSEGLYGRWRLQVMGSCLMPIIISYAYPCSVLHSIKKRGPMILPTLRIIMNEPNCSALFFFWLITKWFQSKGNWHSP